jgi:hypothetical protein
VAFRRVERVTQRERNHFRKGHLVSEHLPLFARVRASAARREALPLVRFLVSRPACRQLFGASEFEPFLRLCLRREDRIRRRDALGFLRR